MTPRDQYGEGVVIWYEAHCPSERISGYFFRTWKEADSWLYRNSASLRWQIREVEKPDDWNPLPRPRDPGQLPAIAPENFALPEKRRKEDKR